MSRRILWSDDPDYLNLDSTKKLELEEKFGSKYDSTKLLPISFVIICKNAERTIKRCLHSIVSKIEQIDEVIVVDTGSTDNTKSLVKDFSPSVKLFQHPWCDNFAESRNAAINYCRHEWIFFIDADEWLESNVVAIRQAILTVRNFNKTLCIAPLIKNNNGTAVIGLPRIFSKSIQARYFGYVHEELRYSDLNPVSTLCLSTIVLQHDGYDDQVVDIKQKLKRNCSLMIKNLQAEPHYVRWQYFEARDSYLVSGSELREIFIDKLKKIILDSSSSLKDQGYKRRAFADLFFIFTDSLDLANLSWLVEKSSDQKIGIP